MGARTGIAWCDCTMNFWWGCKKVSRACLFCYAETLSKRFDGGTSLWGGTHTPRKPASEKTWNDPWRWNRAAEKAGTPLRVFSSSMSDFFEAHPELPALRERAFPIIEGKPWLTWLLLTKRPQNITAMVPKSWLTAWPQNVWIGTSVEANNVGRRNVAWERIGPLLRIPQAPVRFVSVEPMTGPVDLCNIKASNGAVIDALNGDVRDPSDNVIYAATPSVLDWVIAGGESGGAGVARMDPEWLATVAAQCAQTGVPFFFKQAGHKLAAEWGCTGKGDDPAQWPVPFTQRFPRVSSPLELVS